MRPFSTQGSESRFKFRGVDRAVPLAIAVSCGLVTSGLLYSFLAGQPKASAAGMEPMVVAAVDVDDSHVLRGSDLRVVNVAYRPKGAFVDVVQISGRLPLVHVTAGEPILSSHLAAAGAQPGLWHHVRAGMRAVTVGINEVVGVGGFLQPGLRVDVIGVSQDGNTWLSDTIAQDIEVLAIAQDDKSKKGDDKATVATSATVLVTPAQAETISLASERGRIRLVLRAPGDHRIKPMAAARVIAPKVVAKPVAPPPPVARPAPEIRYVERQAAVRAPAQAAHYQAPPPPAPRGIEVIRGNSVEVVHP
jgi:pilus assembly protein CpaB